MIWVVELQPLTLTIDLCYCEDSRRAVQLTCFKHNLYNLCYITDYCNHNRLWRYSSTNLDGKNSGFLFLRICNFVLRIASGKLFAYDETARLNCKEGDEG